jgi:hypothetical protein
VVRKTLRLPDKDTNRATAHNDPLTQALPREVRELLLPELERQLGVAGVCRTCTPWEGRFLLSKTARQAGSLVMREAPAAHMLDAAHFGKRCFYCMRPLGACVHACSQILLRASRCNCKHAVY